MKRILIWFTFALSAFSLRAEEIEAPRALTRGLQALKVHLGVSKTPPVGGLETLLGFGAWLTLYQNQSERVTKDEFLDVAHADVARGLTLEDLYRRAYPGEDLSSPDAGRLVGLALRPTMNGLTDVAGEVERIARLARGVRIAGFDERCEIFISPEAARSY